LNVKLLIILLSVIISTSSISTYAKERVHSNDDKPSLIKKAPLSNQSCISCHKSEAHEWQKSDHQKSMAIANQTTVKGDFNNTTAEHYGQKARFFIENGQYNVEISYDKKQQIFPIKFTFGHYPLQQYLVETEVGKLQVLPFAWDSRVKDEGGQRWYHNYSHEEIRSEDRLHWRQPLQNWNGMCADCHSDGLIRHYDDKKNSFNTQWDNINVGCLSCHGDMSDHSNNQLTSINKATRNAIAKPIGQWLRNIGDKTAHWQGKTRDNAFMDTCFACHSLRSPLTDGFKQGTKFLDQFSPQLLQAPMYHADGQIKEEVYVYGSFLQSKMYAAGVNCLDCHDKHTMKLKIEGNGLCLQCHSGEEFNVKTHHGHDENSVGAQCANCHMPTNRYMGVDDRRDHSFKIPRPDVSQKHATPNACLNCHENETNEWAADKLLKLHGKPQQLSQTRQNLMLLRGGQALSMTEQVAIINDEAIDVISRATALQMLAQYGQPISGELIKAYFVHDDGLLRMSAASLGMLMTATEQNSYIVPLLKDEYKAVRVAAARSLLGVELTSESVSTFNLAYQELTTANQINSWRGEGRANYASQAMRTNDFLGAEQGYLQAINVDPYFEQAYTNLSEFYRQTQRVDSSEKILKQGLAKLPKSSAILYAYGLHLVRQQKHQQAVLQFKRAHQAAPNVEQYLYTFVLSLDSVGKTEQGLKSLLKVHSSFRGSQMIKEMGMYLAKKQQNKSAYDLFIKL
jgi:predicted CXXCH cytochrome family protein